jgi:predicted AAA+ superfamily ATPase
MSDLIKAVCQRLSGHGGVIGSVVRLDTQYGGDRTDGLITRVHAVNGMLGIENVSEFVDSTLPPVGKVRVAALDGENSDPADGLMLGDGVRASSLWGNLTYQLAGAEGYRRVENADKTHVAPSAETIRELFGGESALIMFDCATSSDQRLGVDAPWELRRGGTRAFLKICGGGG